MWKKGTINGFDYCVKHFEEPSQFGICGGRISKLEIRKDGYIYVNYDRGWDVKELGTNDVIDVYNYLIEKYN